jgi:hypothetical protein
MHTPRQMLWSVQLVLNERPVYNQLGCCARELPGSPRLDLPPHRLEVPLHAVDADRDGIDQREALEVFRQKRLEVAMNNMAKLPFELSVRISRARLKPHRGTGIVEP